MNTTGSGIAHKKERNFEREKKIERNREIFCFDFVSSRTNNNNRIGNNKNKK